MQKKSASTLNRCRISDRKGLYNFIAGKLTLELKDEFAKKIGDVVIHWDFAGLQFSWLILIIHLSMQVLLTQKSQERSRQAENLKET